MNKHPKLNAYLLTVVCDVVLVTLVLETVVVGAVHVFTSLSRFSDGLILHHKNIHISYKEDLKYKSCYAFILNNFIITYNTYTFLIMGSIF